MIRLYSATQTVPAISSGESEFYAIVRGTSTGLGMKTNFLDLGKEVSLEIGTDSSAAKTMATRLGLGRARHIETQFLWVQHIFREKKAKIFKEQGTENESDLGTKYVDYKTMIHLLDKLNFKFKEGKSSIALRAAV